MEKIRLSPRLQVLAGYAAPAGRVIDVGCDHGYLPVWLLENGLAESAVATDIHQKPLQKAVDCARAHGVSGRMDFVLTDGLRGLPLHEKDTIVIAGMGGETIAAILDAALPSIRASMRLVLQPMTKPESLVSWLYTAGLHIENECLVKDAGELYRVLIAALGPAKAPDPAGCLAGEALFRNHDPLLPEYLEKLCTKLRRACTGMRSSAKTETQDRAAKLGALLKTLEERKKEVQYDKG